MIPKIDKFKKKGYSGLKNILKIFITQKPHLKRSPNTAMCKEQRKQKLLEKIPPKIMINKMLLKFSKLKKQKTQKIPKIQKQLTHWCSSSTFDWQSEGECSSPSKYI